VLEAVLEAAALELGRMGFAGMRVEDVALLSGVNKTTIYRRWPTKFDLVAAVLEREKNPPTDFDLGSLEADVRASLFELRERMYAARQRGVVQVLLAERAQPEVAQLVRNVRAGHSAVRKRVFERAIARGELPAAADPDILVEFMTSPLASRIVTLGLEVDDAFIEQLAAVLCRGGKAL
jgi:AcrR family transcriptional regulator